VGTHLCDSRSDLDRDSLVRETSIDVVYIGACEREGFVFGADDRCLVGSSIFVLVFWRRTIGWNSFDRKGRKIWRGKLGWRNIPSVNVTVHQLNREQSKRSVGGELPVEVI
jgi:hypothetical protein